MGHARTFLLAWSYTRARRGRVLLRIDDLDRERCRQEFVDRAIDDLSWLGLDWDGEAYVESAGIPDMNRAVQTLLDRGLAYACTCSRSEIESARSAPHAGTAEPRYPGTCRDRYPSREDAERKSGRSALVRLQVPSGPVTFTDGLFGAQAFDVQRDVGDFMIARRDGAPAYQLAVVIDDAHQGVTEVARGADLLPSVARQILVARALELEPPSYFHLPLVTDAEGRRLAKRTRALGLSELRERGADPRKLVAWALRTAGLDVPERVTPREALAAFEVSRLHREPVAVSNADIAAWSEP